MLDYLTFAFELKEVDEQGVFKGYASTFGGSPDLGGDIIERGAFKKTLTGKGKFGTSIKMLWQHNSNLPPVGTWKNLEEDNRGLKVEGQFALKTQMGNELYELTKIGAIDSMSIGYEAIQVTYPKDKEKFRRKLAEIELYEISPVNFPMNPKAGITTVKSMIENATSERQLEEALREAGLTKSAAQYIVSHMRKSLAEKWQADPAMGVLRTLREANSKIRVQSLHEALKSANKNLSGGK